MKYQGVLWPLFACLVSIGQVDAQQAARAEYKQGQATFTQEGKESKWQLWRGGLDTPGNPPGMQVVSLMYSPDGKPGSSLLRISVGKMGEIASLAVLAVEKGPSGTAIYRSKSAKCAVRLTRADAKGAAGGGSCTGRFEEGPAITKFEFSAGS